jgi:hypothetical protein
MTTVPFPRLTAQQVSHAIITAAMRVHSELGPGLLESTYQVCLQHELKKAGFQTEAQVGLPVCYDNVKLELGYRIDLLVEESGHRGTEVNRCHCARPSGPSPFVPEAQWQISWPAYKL